MVDFLLLVGAAQHVLDLEARLKEGVVEASAVEDAWAVFLDALEEVLGRGHHRSLDETETHRLPCGKGTS